MSRAVALVALLLASAAAAPVGGVPPVQVEAGAPSEAPTIVGVYPNPVPEGDVGEFVVIDVPPGTNLSVFALDDGERRARLPPATVSGEVALTRHPERVRPLTDARVLEAPVPGLSNAGERLRLRRGNRTVATVTYEDAPEGRMLGPNGWEPVAGTDRRPVTGGTGVRAFVLPDAARAPIAPVRRADERVWLAAYTLTSPRVRRALLAAEQGGVDVRVLAEASPVGGMSRRQAELLDRLARGGVAVRVFAGPYDPYAFHHAKYVVADGRAVVLTENWKPAGTGGNGSRGWGIGLAGGRPVQAVAATFRADWRGRATVPWQRYRRGRRFEPAEGPPASATFPASAEPLRTNATATVLVAPDNAEAHVVARLRNASESVAVLAPSLERRSAVYRALVGAARRGVEVRVLLAGAWYTRAENAQVVEALRTRAEREGLSLDAKVVDPRGRFAKIHAKGIVVDDSAIVGSMNFNRHSARRNREVVVAVEAPAVADYYRQVFDADWGGGGRRFPVGMAAVLAAGLAVALLAAARIRFGADGRAGGDPASDDGANPPGWEF